MNAGLQLYIERLGTSAKALAQDLHLQVPAGEILPLMGPKGCGKSSVLAAIAGTLPSVSEGLLPLHFAGHVVLITHDEQDVADPQRVVHLRAVTEESPSHV